MNGIEFAWKQATLAEFADFERAQGHRVVQTGEVFWRQVRPFFFRPVLPCQELDVPSAKGPALSGLGGRQWALPNSQGANSVLRLLQFDNREAYAPGKLDYNRRRQIRLASAKFVVKPVLDRDELKQQGHSAYLSFHDRSRYSFKSDRRRRDRFDAWVDSVWRFPKALVLGAYLDRELRAVSVSHWVKDVIYYATFFCDDSSLRLFVSDYMLHTVRASAARSAEVRHIFAGMYRGSNGLDSFYLLRGCKVTPKPARLELNPFAAILLRLCLPRDYAELRSPADSPE